MLANIRDDRQHPQRFQITFKLCQFFFKNYFHLRHFVHAAGERIFELRVQAVHVVKFDVRDVRRVGVNVARHGDVNQKERAVCARLHRLPDHFGRKDGVRRARG